MVTDVRVFAGLMGVVVVSVSKWSSDEEAYVREWACKLGYDGRLVLDEIERVIIEYKEKDTEERHSLMQDLCQRINALEVSEIYEALMSIAVLDGTVSQEACDVLDLWADMLSIPDGMFWLMLSMCLKERREAILQ